MAARQVDRQWMWHPLFSEARTDTAGLFVHFRRHLCLDQLPVAPVMIHVTADTRYKLYVNSRFVALGPVKGDQHVWFYDELDLAPHLRIGENTVAVHVLRFFHATPYAASFARLPIGGLMVRPSAAAAAEPTDCCAEQLRSSSLWETAIDGTTILPTNQPEDDFLHVYEKHNADIETATSQQLQWVPARVYEFQASTGLRAPWKLSPRMIPTLRFQSSSFAALHNIKSTVPQGKWEQTLLRKVDNATACIPRNPHGLVLQAHTSHYFELEVENHTTALLTFRFTRPKHGGSSMTITYAESYENPPLLVPYLRSKDNRCDDTKALYGPQDSYVFRGAEDVSRLGYDEKEEVEEVFVPFHFRTFRFIAVQISVQGAALVLQGIDITPVNYPLDVSARFSIGASEDHETVQKIWQTSVRTLSNCMHDCYEDCPFYEQLQYAMDMRSSAIFTYYSSGDDRLARQALIQIHNTFEACSGLTSSRAPCHDPQIIPHFSLYWICALSDHYSFFGDRVFLRRFLAVIDGVLGFFHSRIDPDFQLVSAGPPDDTWGFTDWTEEWRPYGVPPAVARTGFSTYTNSLYAYTLKNGATILRSLGRESLAAEYTSRAKTIVDALELHCFDGDYFTDGLAKSANPEKDYSVHNQVFAVLSGVATGSRARDILTGCLVLSDTPPCVTSKNTHTSKTGPSPKRFTQPSLSMSFYTLRALSISSLYDQHFHAFFSPWRAQLALGLTTWEEDAVSQRSDCHAWGSVPIYEYLAEVVGIRPAEPGWGAVLWKPRLDLWREGAAAVPIGGKVKGVANVRWWTEVGGNVGASLRVAIEGGGRIPVVVELPGRTLKLVCGAEEVSFVVDRGNRVNGDFRVG